jgi:hypothetical protein
MARDPGQEEEARQILSPVVRLWSNNSFKDRLFSWRQHDERGLSTNGWILAV